jgi:Uncharacterized conserved protein
VAALDTSTTRVVVFGGGTGLSNIVGGDSRRPDWGHRPFTGLKELFPRVNSVVCVTDDGGSTGELQKDLPLIALGDLRHVLISSIRRENLLREYGLDTDEAGRTATALHAIFNYRFISPPHESGQLLSDTGARLADLPPPLLAYLRELVERLHHDPRLAPCLHRPQCLGNLLLASAVYRQLNGSLTAAELLASHQTVRTATVRGLAELCARLGAPSQAVLPCTTTLAQLQVLYSNGVLVTSEDKVQPGQARLPGGPGAGRVQPAPFLQPEVVQLVREADILLFARAACTPRSSPFSRFPAWPRRCAATTAPSRCWWPTSGCRPARPTPPATPRTGNSTSPT